MGKTRDLLMKIGDTCHTNIGTRKDENSKDKQKRLSKNGKNTHKNYTKQFLLTQLAIKVWSLI